MEGRKSWLWASSLLWCAGCLTGGAQKTAKPVAPPPIQTPPAQTAPVQARSAPPPMHVTKVARPDPATEPTPKKDAKRTPRLILAFASFKEGEARSLNAQPEKQFKVRDEARQLYQEAIKADPTLLDAHRGLGRVYVDLADYERALETFKSAQARFPKETIFLFELSQLHNRKQEFGEAIRCLNKALEIDPENRRYTTTLGLTLARAGRTDESLALLTRSMGAASAHYNVGRMLIHMQRTEEGKQQLRLAIRANPNLESARNLLNDLDSNNVRANVSLNFQALE